jgi:hypothetical protein
VYFVLMVELCAKCCSALSMLQIGESYRELHVHERDILDLLVIQSCPGKSIDDRHNMTSPNESERACSHPSDKCQIKSVSTFG